MEFTVVTASNLPPKPILAVHAGSVRRQMKLEVNHPFVLPNPGEKASVEVSVFQQLASQLLPEDGKVETKCTIPVRRPDGTATQVRLEIRRDGSHEEKDGQCIQTYLEEHKVQSNKQLYLALAGFCLISAMLVSRLHGALLVGIFLMSALAWVTGLAAAPEGIFSLPSYDALFMIDFSGWDPGSGKLHAMVLGSLVLLFVALFDLAGVQYGLMGIAGLLEGGHVPRSQSIFSSAAVSTMCGAILGTSPVIIANESSAGIIEGARTGLSAVVVSALFIASAFLTPVLSSIPRVATSVPLVLIGAFMMAPCRGIDWDNLRAAIPSFLTITVVPFTYSIHNGIIAGILMDAFLMISAGKEERDVKPANSPRQPLLNEATRTTSPVLDRLLCTPHATMAYQTEKAMDEVEQAQQLLDRLRHRDGSEQMSCGTNKDKVEDGLLAALEAYLASQSGMTHLDHL